MRQSAAHVPQGKLDKPAQPLTRIDRRFERLVLVDELEEQELHIARRVRTERR